MKGRRREDTLFGEIPNSPKPGDFWKYTSRLHRGEPMKASEWSKDATFPTNLTQTVWGYYSPDGNGLGTLVAHTVREHEDGTISVRPGDGSSNSIMHHGGAQKKAWHGYVERGEWNEA